MILSKFNRLHGLVSCVLLLAGAGVQAQTEPLLVKRAAELREAPGDSSRSLAPLAARTPVTRSGARQGAWIQVRTSEGASGWVHMFDVGSAASAAPAGVGAGALRGLTSFFNKGSAQGGTVTATSTVGIRGLGAEDLARAQPNPTAVVLAEALRQDADQARQFAAQAALSSRAVEPLPVPVQAQPQTANPGGFVNNNN
ncbi:MAG: SH3 domain-containing protein [Polaromonas sp.]|jgi:hypothetical protein|nr:SH3 domain-containing protein [Polaromonas sp.]